MKFNKPKIIFESVNYSYGLKEQFKFENVSISIQENSITALIGRNGAGKTTLLQLMIGYLIPISGLITLQDGESKIPIEGSKGKIAFLPQNEKISFGFTVDDFLMLGRIPFIGPMSQPSGHDYEIVENIKEELEIKQFEQKKLDQISGGELQRVRIGRLLVQKAEILILDEPITYLDISARARIFDLMRELKDKGKTIVFTSHDPLEAFQIADNSILLKKNEEVVFGVTNEVLTDDNLSHCLGSHVEYRSYKGQKFLYLVKRNGYAAE